MKFPVSIKGVPSKRAVLCSLKTNATNENYRAVASNPVNPPETCLVREFAEELGAVVEGAHAVRGSA